MKYEQTVKDLKSLFYKAHLRNDTIDLNKLRILCMEKYISSVDFQKAVDYLVEKGMISIEKNTHFKSRYAWINAWAIEEFEGNIGIYF